MDLSTLKPAAGSVKKRKRLGRGVGSGKGGHSSTRGNKGQKSRTGNHSMPAWFEGGQMPLQRRVPKFGFTNPNRVEYRIFNLTQLSDLIATQRVTSPVTAEQLVAAGLARPNDRIKILGGGEITKPLQIAVHACSKSARAKIEKAGGQIEIVATK